MTIGDVPGEMATLLLGAQGGDEDCFACLYALTNPVLVRYLRVVSDADPAALARSTWPTLVERMTVCVADDDDDWLELAVGTARQSALASAAVGAGAGPAPGRADAAGAAVAPGSDPVDAGVAALRACPPAMAEVLAMGLTAGLGKDSIARITGHEPTEVLALVRAGEGQLAMPLESLVAAMQARGSAAEVGDLPLILPLFAAQSHSPLSAVADPAPEVATAASAGTATVVNLLTSHSLARATSAAVPGLSARAEMSPRWARVGVGAAVWTLGVGGVAAAAAMIGVIPAAIHGLFGDGGNGAVVASHGPVRPGGVPSPAGGGPGTGRGTGPGTAPGTASPPSAGQPGPQGQVGPATAPVSASPTGRGIVVSAAEFSSGASTRLVVVPAVLTVSSSGSTVTTPSALGSSTPTSTPQPPSSGTVAPLGVVAGAGAGTTHASGKRHLTHTTGLAKGRSQTAQPAAKTVAAAARAQAQKAAKAKAAKAKAAGQAAAARVRAAKSRA